MGVNEWRCTARAPKETPVQLSSVSGSTTAKRDFIRPLRMPGKAGNAYRAGDNLALGTHTHTGTHTWEQFLTEHTS